jgi:glutamate-1-semialdehyde aminotransferase
LARAVAIQRFCRDAGCLFVLDEIVTGFRFEVRKTPSSL